LGVRVNDSKESFEQYFLSAVQNLNRPEIFFFKTRGAIISSKYSLPVWLGRNRIAPRAKQTLSACGSSHLQRNGIGNLGPDAEYGFLRICTVAASACFSQTRMAPACVPQAVSGTVSVTGTL
jgi:hypothetical protein